MGVGRQTLKSLNSMYIKTIGDLARLDKVQLIEMFGKHGAMLWEYANGIDNSEVNYLPSKPKGIGNSVTLPRNFVTKEEISPDSYIEKSISVEEFLFWIFENKKELNTKKCCSSVLAMMTEEEASKLFSIYEDADLLIDAIDEELNIKNKFSEIQNAYRYVIGYAENKKWLRSQI